MFGRKWLTAGVAVLVGGGLAAGIPGLAAVGQKSPVEQTSPPGSPDILLSAQLVTRGAAANVSVQYLCFPGDFPSIQVTLNQRSGNATTSGTSFLTPPLTCDGLIHTVPILITAAPKPFVQGTALGQLFFFNFNSSGLSTDVRSIPVTKK
jgi:hypothetical protein